MIHSPTVRKEEGEEEKKQTLLPTLEEIRFKLNFDYTSSSAAHDITCKEKDFDILFWR